MLIITICIVIAYGNAALTHGFVSWDDPQLIINNPYVQSVTPRTLIHIFTTFDPQLYIPLTFFSFQINHLIGGLHPAGYHIANVLLHIFNAILVFRISNKLTKHTAVASITAALFALHPLQTEAVLWVSGRKDVLATFFFLCAFSTHIAAGAKRSKAVLALSIAAMLSKVSAISIGPILLLHDVILTGKTKKESLKTALPILVSGGVFGVIGTLGKKEVIGAIDWQSQLLMSAKAIWQGIKAVLTTKGLSFWHAQIEPVSFASVEFFIAVCMAAALCAFVALSYKKNPLASFGVCFYLLALMPTFAANAQGHNISFIADRYFYLPSIGLFLCIGILARLTYEHLGIPKLHPSHQLLALLIICAPLTFLTKQRSHVWQNDKTLLESVIVRYPAWSKPYERLGAYYQKEGKAFGKQEDFIRAEEWYLQAISLEPDAIKWSNLGTLYADMGEYDKEIAAYENALKTDPGFVPAQMNLKVAKQAAINR